MICVRNSVVHATDNAQVLWEEAGLNDVFDFIPPEEYAALGAGSGGGV
jgi:hypothetical protein